MKKAELIDQMARDAEITKKEAAAALDSIIENITESLKKEDGKMRLAGLGTFAKAHRKARTGRNPQTGEPIQIKAHNVVTFKASKALKDEI